MIVSYLLITEFGLYLVVILDLPESILQSLSSVLTQLQQVLPAPKTNSTDFSAIAFRWENQQLVAIQQPKKCIWKI